MTRAKRVDNTFRLKLSLSHAALLEGMERVNAALSLRRGGSQLEAQRAVFQRLVHLDHRAHAHVLNTGRTTGRKRTMRTYASAWQRVRLRVWYGIGAVLTLSITLILRCFSCRYNERQLIDVTVVRRVRPRAIGPCDCEGHHV